MKEEEGRWKEIESEEYMNRKQQESREERQRLVYSSSSSLSSSQGIVTEHRKGKAYADLTIL